MLKSPEEQIQEFTYDLNWVNNTLHDFAWRVAFMETVEDLGSLNEKVPLILGLYHAVSNDAVLKITSIYDSDPKVISIFYLRVIPVIATTPGGFCVVVER